jgi:ribonuclease P protein component
MDRLLQRRDFLAAAKAPAVSLPSIVVQARKRDDMGGPRVGFTCTKKLGNAVARNRIRRRIKEAARLTMPEIALPAHDYVLIGRSAAETRGFEDLRKDIISALTKLHAGQGKSFSRPRNALPRNKDQQS